MRKVSMIFLYKRSIYQKLFITLHAISNYRFSLSKILGMNNIIIELKNGIKAENMDKSKPCLNSHVRVLKYEDPTKRKETKLYEGNYFGTL